MASMTIRNLDEKLKALDSSDATKITYLSPVISGFRAGISASWNSTGT